MKVIDMKKHDIIDSGQTWPYPQKPCSKDMLPLLEQNESIVTWVAPRGSRSMLDQFPVIRINRDYYSISLRMMKAIWRHVRLAKDFINVDVSKDGKARLRIPVKLFGEKKRTQNRFNTMRNRPPSSSSGIKSVTSVQSGSDTPNSTIGSGNGLGLLSLSSSSFSSCGSLSPSPASNPGTPTLQQNSKYHTTSRAHRLFCDLILPLAEDDVYPNLPEKTAFIFTEEDILSSTLTRIDKKCPQLFKDREKFLRTVEQIVFGSVIVFQ